MGQEATTERPIFFTSLIKVVANCSALDGEVVVVHGEFGDMSDGWPYICVLDEFAAIRAYKNCVALSLRYEDAETEKDIRRFVRKTTAGSVKGRLRCSEDALGEISIEALFAGALVELDWIQDGHKRRQWERRPADTGR